MSPIRWGGQSQSISDARSDPRPGMPGSFADGVQPPQSGFAVGRADTVGGDTPHPRLGPSMCGTKLHPALDA